MYSHLAFQDRAITLDLIQRAERAGYTTLAVTVDTPVLGRREADLRNQFKLPSHLTMGNFKGTCARTKHCVEGGKDANTLENSDTLPGNERIVIIIT